MAPFSWFVIVWSVIVWFVIGLVIAFSCPRAAGSALATPQIAALLKKSLRFITGLPDVKFRLEMTADCQRVAALFLAAETKPRSGIDHSKNVWQQTDNWPNL
jgi:hypothetical protein